MVTVNAALSIPDEEIHFRASRSGGPGGQHVNKVSSRVTLRFDVLGSEVLTAEQKRRILEALGTRIGNDGVLRVVAQGHRSQARNREAAVVRFAELLRQTLAPRAPRIESKVPRTAQRRRVEAKKLRGRLKRFRSAPPSED